MQKTQTLAEAVSAYEKDKAQKSLAEKQTESRAARNSILNDARLIGTTARQLVAGIEKVSGDKASKARQLIDSFRRMQPHGPQLSLRKHVFIKPMFIGAAASNETPVKSYVVR